NTDDATASCRHQEHLALGARSFLKAFVAVVDAIHVGGDPREDSNAVDDLERARGLRAIARLVARHARATRPGDLRAPRIEDQPRRDGRDPEPDEPRREDDRLRAFAVLD